jgi:hypothetical protein
MNEESVSIILPSKISVPTGIISACISKYQLHASAYRRSELECNGSEE